MGCLSTVSYLNKHHLPSSGDTFLHLNTHAIDFVLLVFPLADMNVVVYTKDMNVEEKGDLRSVYSLKLNKSPYNLKQGSLNWDKKLKTALIIRGHGEFTSGPCIFISKL